MGWAKSKIEIMAIMGSKIGWEIEKKNHRIRKIISVSESLVLRQVIKMH